jgi:hypothetical protein
MAEPPPRGPGGRFTSSSGSYYGKLGAAERERRFLEPYVTRAERKRRERERRRWAFAIMERIYGPSWRPRRHPRIDPELIPLLPEVDKILVEALHATK